MSEFWQKKMRTYFRRIDFDHDGAVTRKDFEAMGNRFAESGRLEATKADHLKEALFNIWDLNLKVAGHTDSLSEETFVNIMKDVAFNKDHHDILQGPLPLFFLAVDTNQDGQIEMAEYEHFFDTLGMDKALAADAFKAIDTNNDGMLSEEEFVQAGLLFFTSEQENDPDKHFWGELVQ